MAGKSLQALDVPIENVDPFQESINYFVVIAFPRVRSPNFKMALTVAKCAARFAASEMGEEIMYIAAFGDSQAEVGKAATLLRYVKGWSGALIFCKGKLVPMSGNLTEIAHCYLDSFSCIDQKAHCHTVIDDPLFKEIRGEPFFKIEDVRKYVADVKQYSVPCKPLWRGLKFQASHPSSLTNQLQAAAVAYGCHICPKFNHEDFKEIGVRRHEYWR